MITAKEEKKDSTVKVLKPFFHNTILEGGKKKRELIEASVDKDIQGSKGVPAKKKKLVKFTGTASFCAELVTNKKAEYIVSKDVEVEEK